jgi:hypothetical protein
MENLQIFCAQDLAKALGVFANVMMHAGAKCDPIADSWKFEIPTV